MIGTAGPLAIVLCAAAFAAEEPKPDPAAMEFFEKQVRPALTAQCFSCHGPQQQFSSLRVDSRDALLKGGNRGPALIPGDATQSLLARAVRHDDLKMPVGGKLPAEQIAAIEKWIEARSAVAGRGLSCRRPGRKLPASTSASAKSTGPFNRCATSQPEQMPGVAHPVDRFLIPALRKAGLQPAPPGRPRARLSAG